MYTIYINISLHNKYIIISVHNNMFIKNYIRLHKLWRVFVKVYRRLFLYKSTLNYFITYIYVHLLLCCCVCLAMFLHRIYYTFYIINQ